MLISFICEEEYRFTLHIVLWAGSHDVSADLRGVQVVVDESFDDAGELRSNEQVAGGFKSGDDGS